MMQITTVIGEVLTVSPLSEPVEMTQVRFQGTWYYRPLSHVLEVESDIGGFVRILVTEFMARNLRHKIAKSMRFTGYWEQELFHCFLADYNR